MDEISIVAVHKMREDTWTRASPPCAARAHPKVYYLAGILVACCVISNPCCVVPESQLKHRGQWFKHNKRAYDNIMLRPMHSTVADSTRTEITSPLAHPPSGMGLTDVPRGWCSGRESRCYLPPRFSCCFLQSRPRNLPFLKHNVHVHLPTGGALIA